MLIFWDQRIAFLATPKAGSTAVESALESLACVAIQRPAILKHTDLRAWRRFVGPWLTRTAGAEFTTVALMREPVDWLRSWYRFKLRDDEDSPTPAMAQISFDSFAHSYAAGDSPVTAGIGSQSSFLCDGAARVDRIFRYDQIGEMVGFLEERLDCAIELPRINVPPPVDVGLSDATEAELRAAMQSDIALYNSL